MRGLFTAAALIAIALACLVVSRKLEHERRLMAKLRKHGAVSPDSGVSLSGLSDGERDAADSLAMAGVLVLKADRCYIQPGHVPAFRRKRTRLAISGALGAVLLAGLIAMLILRR